MAKSRAKYDPPEKLEPIIKAARLLPLNPWNVWKEIIDRVLEEGDYLKKYKHLFPDGIPFAFDYPELFEKSYSNFEAMEKLSIIGELEGKAVAIFLTQYPQSIEAIELRPPQWFPPSPDYPQNWREHFENQVRHQPVEFRRVIDECELLYEIATKLNYWRINPAEKITGFVANFRNTICESGDGKLSILSHSVIEALQGCDWRLLRQCEICKHVFWARSKRSATCDERCDTNKRQQKFRNKPTQES